MANTSSNEYPILVGATRFTEPGLVQTVDQLSLLKSPCLSRKNMPKNSYAISSRSIERPSPQRPIRAATTVNKPLAVSIRNLCLSYDDRNPILSNLCMNVERGTIYGLLGSSGCGKTTLLNCIVGLKKWESGGEILVFNKRPGTKGSGIPGGRLGFMPQDIALYDQISVKEMIEYYGRLYGMPDAEVAKQVSFLIEFLQLPANYKLIRDLSGGQRRRVSLSLALVHCPDLLILDEPTVGLDPERRQSIWEYLHNMVETRKTTVILSTHYIEECSTANTIGVMRKGRLLAENSPSVLLKQFECDLLEQVVLKLCQNDELSRKVSGYNQGNSRRKSSFLCPKTNSRELMAPPDAIIINDAKNSNSYLNNCKLRQYDDECSRPYPSSSMFQRIRALAVVMWLLLFRHPIFTAITMLTPAMQILVTVAVIGVDPKGMKIGIVNEELPTFPVVCKNYAMANYTERKSCDFKQLSCIIIKEIQQTGNIETIPIQSTELAYKQVKQGSLMGYINFPSNYSQHVLNLKIEKMFAENETLEGSRVKIRMDMTNYLGAAIAIRTMFDAYERFARQLAFSCKIDPREFLLPLEYRDPVFGNNEPTYHEFIAPMIFITVIFQVPMVVTAMLYISDKKQGTFCRARVAGLRFKEVLVCYILTQTSIILVQTIVCYYMMKFVFDMQVLGSIFIFFGVVILFGVCSESLGILLGIFLNDEVEALMFAIFIGPAFIFYEGAIWPLEAIPWIPWRMISYVSPTTLLCVSFRSIITKGLGFTHSLVWPGIATISGYTVLFCVLSVLVFIMKNK